MSWVVQHLKTGLIVEPNDVNAIVDALLYARENPSQREGWAVNAYERFHANFKIDAVAEKTLELYNRVLND